MSECNHTLGIFSHSEDGVMSTIRQSAIDAEGGKEEFDEYLDLWASDVRYFKFCPECGRKLNEIVC